MNEIFSELAHLLELPAARRKNGGLEGSTFHLTAPVKQAGTTSPTHRFGGLREGSDIEVPQICADYKRRVPAAPYVACQFPVVGSQAGDALPPGNAGMGSLHASMFGGTFSLLKQLRGS